MGRTSSRRRDPGSTPPDDSPPPAREADRAVPLDAATGEMIFTDGGALYMLDTVSSRKNKILDGLGKITEPSWSR